MIGDEARIVDAFCQWLVTRGWHTQPELDYVDVVATRGDRRIFAEAKGRTTCPGLDVDTLYGQLLRRVPRSAIGHDILAVVVPDVVKKFAERVPIEVRRVLNIHIFTVSELGSVQCVGDGLDPTL